MRTFEHAKNTDSLGRYYTNVEVSRLLVNSLPPRLPKKLVDLGAGEGALSLEASKRWAKLNLITVDVDSAASRILSQKLSHRGFVGTHRHIQRDALRIDLQTCLADDQNGGPEAAICNPPFIIPTWRKGYSHILEDVGLSSVLPAITSTDAAALFLAQNLRVLEEGGAVSIIVPDSLASAEKYFRFRRKLLERFDLRQVIRLPRGAFSGTDALAHIFVIVKRRPIDQKVRLSLLPALGAALESVEVERDEAAKRLDYQYHAYQSKSSKLTVGNVLIDLSRGSFNSAQARNQNFFVLHTTDINTSMRGVWFDFKSVTDQIHSASKGVVMAEHGDILISRVGRNAPEKVIGVSDGKIAISDCVYRLRVASEYRLRVMQSLISETGRNWLNNHLYGVAARQLTKTDLLAFPLEAYDRTTV